MPVPGCFDYGGLVIQFDIRLSGSVVLFVFYLLVAPLLVGFSLQRFTVIHNFHFVLYAVVQL